MEDFAENVIMGSNKIILQKHSFEEIIIIH